MKKDQLIYLDHILICIEKIEDYTKNITKEEFLNRPILQDAVIRNLEIIGEATKHLDQEFRLKYSEIAWKSIAGMRDKLIHDYIGVDVKSVWKTIEEVIPVFHEQVLKILKIE